MLSASEYLNVEEVSIQSQSESSALVKGMPTLVPAENEY
jgi:hypothetical protein